MDAPTLRRAASAITVGVGGLLWLAAILFMAQTAQNSEQFSRLHPWILMINIAGLAVLVGLLATKLAQLIRDWRGHGEQHEDAVGEEAFAPRDHVGSRSLPIRLIATVTT